MANKLKEYLQQYTNIPSYALEDSEQTPLTGAATKWLGANTRPAKPDASMVDTRDFINTYGSRYGIQDGDIGWLGDKSVQGGGYVTLGGQQIGSPSLNIKGNSFMDKDALTKAVDGYAGGMGLTNMNQQWKSPYADAIERLMREFESDKFEFNPDTDPLMKSYSDRFTREGDAAADKALADFTSLTGGRLNSAAAATGAQAHQVAAKKIADVLPMVRENAFNEHQSELGNIMSLINEYLQREEADYGRFADNRNYSRNNFENDRSFNENRRVNDRSFNEGKRINDREYDYQVGRDKVADGRYANEMKYKKEQDKLDRALQQGQLSVSQYNAKTSRLSQEWAKDPSNPDNKYKQMQIDDKADEETYDYNYGQALTKFDAMDPKAALDKIDANYDFYEQQIGTKNLTALIMRMQAKKNKDSSGIQLSEEDLAALRGK